MGDSPEKKPSPGEGARRLASLFAGLGKNASAAAPRPNEAARGSEPAIETIDGAWDDDDDDDEASEEASDEPGERDSTSPSGSSAEPRRGAADRAAARKRKAQQRSERKKTRAVAVAQKQKQKKRKKPSAITERDEADEPASSEVLDDVQPMAISNRIDTRHRDWRRMGLMVAALLVIGALILLVLTRLR